MSTGCVIVVGRALAAAVAKAVVGKAADIAQAGLVGLHGLGEEANDEQQEDEKGRAGGG